MTRTTIILQTILDGLHERYPELKAESRPSWGPLMNAEKGDILGITITNGHHIHPTYMLRGDQLLNTYNGKIVFNCPIAAPDIVDQIANHATMLENIAHMDRMTMLKTFS